MTQSPEAKTGQMLAACVFVSSAVREGMLGRRATGVSDIDSNLTPCNGLTVAAYVSFEGLIKVPK